jgi:hypothetical protein
MHDVQCHFTLRRNLADDRVKIAIVLRTMNKVSANVRHFLFSSNARALK